MKKQYRLCAHGGIKQWVGNDQETPASVVNCISVSSLLDIAIHMN